MKRSFDWSDRDCELTRAWLMVRTADGKFLFRTESDRAMVSRCKDRLEFLEDFYRNSYHGANRGTAEIEAARVRLRRANEIFLAHGNPAFKYFMARVISPLPESE